MPTVLGVLHMMLFAEHLCMFVWATWGNHVHGSSEIACVIMAHTLGGNLCVCIIVAAARVLAKCGPPTPQKTNFRFFVFASPLPPSSNVESYRCGEVLKHDAE